VRNDVECRVDGDVAVAGYWEAGADWSGDGASDAGAWTVVVDNDVACADSSSWYAKKKPSRDCDWVAKKSKRCADVDDGGAYAAEACPEACGTACGAERLYLQADVDGTTDGDARGSVRVRARVDGDATVDARLDGRAGVDADKVFDGAVEIFDLRDDGDTEVVALRLAVDGASEDDFLEGSVDVGLRVDGSDEWDSTVAATIDFGGDRDVLATLRLTDSGDEKGRVT